MNVSYPDISLIQMLDLVEPRTRASWPQCCVSTTSDNYIDLTFSRILQKIHRENVTGSVHFKLCLSEESNDSDKDDRVLFPEHEVDRVMKMTIAQRE